MDTYLLTKSQAAQRSSELTEITYNLRIFTGQTKYSGILTITFLLTSQSRKTWLDFKGDQILFLKVNQVDSSWFYKDYKIEISELKEGLNHVEIGFINQYSRDGFGLHHFQDPSDGKIYIYTHLEPFSANRFFPCFDQPDLKATVTFLVKCLSRWTVISNENFSLSSEDFGDFIDLNEENPEEIKKVVKISINYPISTYILALCLGDYQVFPSNDEGTPLKIYIRESLSTYIDPSLYFNYMRTSLNYYEDFFSHRYPFNKLDIVFIPEMVIGAMENVGCITFNENFILHRKATSLMRQSLCNLISHEISHMWFGDLVSIKWWDDIWLKESFATFMASLCIAETLSLEFQNVWQEFSKFKTWGYDTDQLDTTHPICVNVSNTAETRSNFDGISYSKGSAVLKQLFFITGREIFKRACGKFVNKFKFSVAKYEDFIETICSESGSLTIDLKDWSDQWILKAGLNILEPIVQEENGITHVSIKQSPSQSAHQTLRKHLIHIEAYDENLNSIANEKVLIDQEGITELSIFQDINFKALLINSNDWGYCKVRLDPASFDLIKGNIFKVQNPLNRIVFHRALKMMVEDLKISAAEYLNAMNKEILQENDLSTLSYIFTSVNSVLYNFLPKGQILFEYAHQVFSTLTKKIKQDSDIERKNICFQNLKDFVYSEEDVIEAVSWVKNDSNLFNSCDLSLEKKIHIVKEFSAWSCEALELLTSFKSDLSVQSFKLTKNFCKAKVPMRESKFNTWMKIMEKGEKMSRYERKNIMIGFNDMRQDDLLSEFADLYFQNLDFVAKNKDREFVIDYCSQFVPSYLEPDDLISRLENSLASFPEEQFEAYRSLKEKLGNTYKNSKTQKMALEFLSKSPSI